MFVCKTVCVRKTSIYNNLLRIFCLFLCATAERAQSWPDFSGCLPILSVASWMCDVMQTHTHTPAKALYISMSRTWTTTSSTSSTSSSSNYRPCWTMPRSRCVGRCQQRHWELRVPAPWDVSAAGARLHPKYYRAQHPPAAPQSYWPQSPRRPGLHQEEETNGCASIGGLTLWPSLPNDGGLTQRPEMLKRRPQKAMDQYG